MLANLLRLTYLCQLALGAWLGWTFFPTMHQWLPAAVGALALPVLIHGLAVASSVVLSGDDLPDIGEPMLKRWLKRGRLFWAETRTALQVYLGRQVWLAHQPGQPLDGVEPASGHHAAARVPVVLVHGHLCNHRVWDDVVRALRRQGHSVITLDLEPLFTSIDDYACRIESAVQTLCQHSGQGQVALLGHSQGGLAIRAWMRAYGNSRVHRVVTLGTPHQGTRLANWSNTPNGRQMRPGSDWLRELAASESAHTRGLMHLLVSDSDNVVFPQTSQALEGASLTTWPGLGHLELCVHPGVITWLCQLLGPVQPAPSAAGVSEQTAQVPLHAPETEAVARPASMSELYWAFSWMALQGFGGVLSVVQRELVERRKWLTQTQFVEDWSVSQILPGPNVVNLALMMGDRYFGWRGGLVAMAGITSLPMLLVLLLGIAFSGVADVPEVKGALRGMGAVAAGMIAANGLKLMGSFRSNALGKRWAYLMALATFCSAAFLRLPLVWTLLGIGGLSCTLAFLKLRHRPHDQST